MTIENKLSNTYGLDYAIKEYEKVYEFFKLQEEAQLEHMEGCDAEEFVYHEALYCGYNEAKRFINDQLRKLGWEKNNATDE